MSLGSGCAIAFVSLCVFGCRTPELHRLPSITWLSPGASDRVGFDPQTMPIDLAAVLELAGSTALEVELARAHAAEAEARADVADAMWYPRLRPRLTFQQTDGQVQNTAGTFVDVDRQSSYAGGGLELRVDLGDAWFESLGAAQRSEAARLGITAARHVQSGRAVSIYFDLLQARASLDVAEYTRAHADELVANQQAKARSGTGLPVDVLRAQAFAASVEGRVAAFEARARSSAADLAALLLLPESFELTPIDAAVVPIEFAAADLDLGDLLARALVHRPDLHRAMVLSEVAATALVRSDYRWLIPSLRAGVDLGGFGVNASSLDDRTDLFVGLEWDVSLGNPAESRVNDAVLRQAELEVLALQNHIRAELSGAKSDVVAARSQIEAARRQVEAAAAATVLVKVRLDAGSALLLEVFDAERIETEAKLSLVAAICDHNRAQFELLRLVGGPIQ